VRQAGAGGEAEFTSMRLSAQIGCDDECRVPPLSSLSKPSKWQSLYLHGSACILLFASLAKAASLNQDLQILRMHDGILHFLTKSQLLIIVGCLEFVVGASLWLMPNLRVRTKLSMVTWIAALFLTYRLGLLISGDPTPCKCLGDLLGWTGLSDEVVEAISVSMLFYLLLPSAGWLFLYSRHGSRASRVT
jgi:hypothetical protein